MSKRQGKYTAPARITRARWRTPSQDSELALAATTAGGRIELGNVGLVVGGGILAGRSTASAVLQEGHATQAGVSVAAALVFAAAALAILAALTMFTALALLATLTMLGIAVDVGLLRVGLLALLLRIALLAFLAVLAVAPTLVVALDEAARALDHAEVVVGVLPVGFRCDAIARGRRFAGQRLVFVEHLMCVAAHPHVRPAAIEDLVLIGRTIGIVIVML